MGSLRVVGPTNAPQKIADLVHVTAYRAIGEELIKTQLQVAVALKPHWLTLSAWNEFGSATDEPSPDLSWTLMPNNKFGRRYSKILKDKIEAYKTAP
ncbi:MAG: hypothetical protein HZA93_16140 [Verrucomicrobia bacterium]|nr:hypothetical protein [Verrucomicrobiota bacterium]